MFPVSVLVLPSLNILAFYAGRIVNVNNTQLLRVNGRGWLVRQ
jgi:hypothetical protein